MKYCRIVIFVFLKKIYNEKYNIPFEEEEAVEEISLLENLKIFFKQSLLILHRVFLRKACPHWQAFFCLGPGIMYVVNKNRKFLFLLQLYCTGVL